MKEKSDKSDDDKQSDENGMQSCLVTSRYSCSDEMLECDDAPLFMSVPVQ